MATTIVASATVKGTASTINVPAPTGLQDDDEIVVAVGNGSGSNPSAPDGTWTSAHTGSGTQRMSVFRKRASGEGSSWTFTLGGTTGYVAHSVAVRGVDSAGSPVLGSGQNNASSTSVVAPAQSPSVTNCVLIGAFFVGTGTTLTIPGSMSPLENDVQGSNRLALCYEQLVSSGSTGTRTGTAGAAAANAGYLVALPPASVAGQSQLLTCFP